MLSNNLQMCFFCEEVYPINSCFINNHDGIWICDENGGRCEFIMSKRNTIETNVDCPVCFETKKTIELPTCSHRVCLDCCKTIYFGSDSTVQRPSIQWKEFESPIWPFHDEEEGYEEKIEEYSTFEIVDYENKSYDELVNIRNSLINQRPDWMNTEVFINYENNNFKYHLRCSELDSEWELYQQGKKMRNCLCPLCRSTPF